LDEDYPGGWRYYWQSVNVPELSDEVLDRLVEHAAAASANSTIDVWYQGGAIARVGEQETAFANRSEPYLLGIEANWEAAPDSERNVQWVRETFGDIRSLAGSGIDLNFPGFLEEGEQLLQEGHGANYQRLVEAKTKYDPTNLFRLNANIEPRAS
jgi:berberine-like enzyme